MFTACTSGMAGLGHQRQARHLGLQPVFPWPRHACGRTRRPKERPGSYRDAEGVAPRPVAPAAGSRVWNFITGNLHLGKTQVI